ncbi:MAG: glycosyltransferase [Alphaproteobacteria bacterium]|nr:glycosyltransferase [Alphaproteobacteria bacterium]
MIAILAGLWCLGAAAFWAVAWIAVERVRALPRLREAEAPAPAAWPRLSVVSPACNEEEAIEASVRSLLVQDYPDLEIVAVDDRSTDRTGALLDALAEADPRLAVEHIQRLPEGWLGKLNALQRGVARASGDWLLFADADTVYAPHALRHVVAFCEAEGVDLLTLFPELLPMGLLGDATIFAAGVFGSPAGRMWAVADPDSDAFCGLGAFILVRRAAFARTPGFEWLRLEVADDMGLGLMVKRAGGACRVGQGVGLLKLRWYRDFSEMSRKMQKNFYGILGRFSAARVLSAVAFLLATVLFPLAALAPGLPAWAVLPGLALMHLATLRMTGWLELRRPARWLPELGLLGMAWIMVRAAWIGAREDGITWRGVRYPASELRGVQKVRF